MLFPEATDAAKAISAAIKANTAAIDRLTTALTTLGVNVDEALEKIRLAVEKTETTHASALAFIQGIVEELRKHAGEVDKVNELADRLAATDDALATAIVATPS